MGGNGRGLAHGPRAVWHKRRELGIGPDRPAMMKAPCQRYPEPVDAGVFVSDIPGNHVAKTHDTVSRRCRSVSAHLARFSGDRASSRRLLKVAPKMERNDVSSPSARSVTCLEP